MYLLAHPGKIREWSAFLAYCMRRAEQGCHYCSLRLRQHSLQSRSLLCPSLLLGQMYLLRLLMHCGFFVLDDSVYFERLASFHEIAFIGRFVVFGFRLPPLPTERAEHDAAASFAFSS